MVQGLGFDKIRELFGMFGYGELGNGLVKIDHKWVNDNLVLTEFPGVGLLKCHKKIQPQLLSVFKEIKKNKLSGFVTTERGGGCFSPRHTMWDRNLHLSTHCWAISIDLNVLYNIYGKISPADMSFRRNNVNTKRVIEIFERNGFVWGGDYSQVHPAHFEWVRFV